MNLIALVEDEPSIREVVSLYLKRAGFIATAYPDGLAALEGFNLQMPDLVVLDVMLPGMDGFTLMSRLREHSDIPIILLTSRREESDRIAGLELGADDYVVKPFSPQELVSRIRAVLRRVQPSPESGDGIPLSFGDLSINPKTRLITHAGQEILLTPKEFDMLYYMAQHPRQVFTRDQLLQSIWGISEFIDPGTVTVHIRRLREKIEENPTAPSRIVTVWGVGYKFEP